MNTITFDAATLQYFADVATELEATDFDKVAAGIARSVAAHQARRKPVKATPRVVAIIVPGTTPTTRAADVRHNSADRVAS
jgi:methionine synthase I (cobalamin-dependent)